MATVTNIFFGELPPSISLMTPTGLPVYFYMGYHVTADQEIIDFLKTQKNIANVTGKVKLADVPTPPARKQGNTWHANSEPTSISPTELLQRAVAANTSTVAANTAQSNS